MNLYVHDYAPPMAGPGRKQQPDLPTLRHGRAEMTMRAAPKPVTSAGLPDGTRMA